MTIRNSLAFSGCRTCAAIVRDALRNDSASRESRFRNAGSARALPTALVIHNKTAGGSASRSGEARHRNPGDGTVSPENGSRRACSRLGPSRHGSIRGHTARRRPNRCAAHREPFSCVDGFIPGLGKRARGGTTSNGSACRSGRKHLGAGTRQAEPRPARQSEVVAVVRIVTWGVDSAPHRALFPSPSIHIQRRKRTAP